MSRRAIAALALLVACTRTPARAPVDAARTPVDAARTPVDAARSPVDAASVDGGSTRTAADYTLDGFKLGTNYLDVGRREPYGTPCDEDVVGARRAIAYGGQDCGGVVFPEHTTIVLFITAKYGGPGPKAYDAPLEAFAWMGGPYLDERGDFPGHVGDPADRLAVLGPARGDATLTDHDVTLTVRRFDGDVRALIDHDVVAGFVLGPMPDDVRDADWGMIGQMYRRYTPRPGGGSALTRDECKQAMAHVAELARAAPSADKAQVDYLGSDAAVDKCVDRLDRTQLACLLAAKDLAAATACTPR